MARLQTADLKAGMTVTEAVMTPRRMLLLPAGTVLTEAHLTTMRTWGVKDVLVDAEAPAPPPVPAADVTPLEDAAVRARFIHVDLDRPFAAALLAAALKHAAKPS